MSNNKKYNIILADPPWKLDNVKTGGSMNSGAAAKYRTTSTYDLCCMPVRYLLEDDCILFMWYLNSMPEDAIQLAKAWGFKKFLSMNGLVWHKLTKNGLTHFGMGNGTRASTESVMIMYNGSLSRLIKDKSIRNIFEAKMPFDENKRGKPYIHSAKPDEVFDIINKLCGDVPRLEMFARKKVKGWDVFGNEAPNSIDIKNKDQQC
jgi:N6-adenosine-specific RNA methylase IME4